MRGARMWFFCAKIRRFFIQPFVRTVFKAIFVRRPITAMLRKAA